MSNARIIYHQHQNVAPDKARELRAHAWRYIFECHAKRKAARLSDPYEATSSTHDRAMLLKPRGGQHDLTKNQTTATEHQETMKGRTQT